jgi:hypothetical protein
VTGSIGDDARRHTQGVDNHLIRGRRALPGLSHASRAALSSPPLVLDEGAVMRGSRIASIVAVAGCIPFALSGAAPAADSGTLIGSDSPGALQSIQPDTIFANFTCPSDAFCLYHDASYRGDIWYSSDASGRYQLSHAPIRSFQ